MQPVYQVVDIAAVHANHCMEALRSSTQLQAVLSQLERPLLCTSAHVEEQEQLEIPEAAMFIDMYAGQGLDFVVDTGQRVSLAWRAGPAHALQQSAMSFQGFAL